MTYHECSASRERRKNPAKVAELQASSFRGCLCIGVSVNDVRVMPTRPRSEDWHVVADVEFLPSLRNPNKVVEIFEIAGMRRGLGDWRPKFGEFSVTQLE